MDKRTATYFLPLLLAMFWHAVGHAADTPISDRVSFRVEASREVQNDQVDAVLLAQAEERDAAKLANDINQTMNWAMQQVRTGGRITPRSGNYRTYPVYDNKKIVRWRGVQELRLESQDVQALSRLLGSLQERLQIQSMQFSVSTATRDEIEDELITEALAAFRRRASLIAKSLGASDYGLLDVSVSGAGRPPLIPVRMESAARISTASVSPPALEQGSSRISVQVSGSIRLLRK